MMHHIICDWSSEGVIWRSLSALYRCLTRGQQPELQSLPIQHGDYAQWQQQRVANGAFAADLAFWEENLRLRRYWNCRRIDPVRASLPSAAPANASGSTAES